MSNWKTHLIVGSIIGSTFFLLAWLFIGWFEISVFTLLASAIIIFVYSLAPDLDHPLGKLTWIFIGFSILILLYGVLLKEDFYLYFGLAFLVFTYICAKYFGHRKFIHSWLAGIIFSLPLFFLGIEFALLGFICFFSHLCVDKIPFKFV